VEEAREVAAAEGDDLLAELADVQEVYAALLAAYGVDPVAVEACRAQRRAERGGFERRLWLHWVE
jgi:predicted house-cleaning noncanonical NTP pyrophosphatase (MazG superfamily)